jgi:hypothetical protein
MIDHADRAVPLRLRKEVFLAVVKAQDLGASVTQSRVIAVQRFHVSRRMVRAIEREGLDNLWPPLGADGPRGKRT